MIKHYTNLLITLLYWDRLFCTNRFLYSFSLFFCLWLCVVDKAGYMSAFQHMISTSYRICISVSCS